MNVAAKPLSGPTAAVAEVGAPQLIALSTAVPKHEVTQEIVRENVREYLSSRTDVMEYLAPIFINARVDTRYACQPYDWYLQEHTFEEKNDAYVTHALALAEEVATKALDSAKLKAEDIDAIVCVSTTGLMTPSLDARLMNLLPFRRDTMRLPIFGLACAGGTLGMTRAAQISRSRPGMRVMLIVLELCSLAIRHDRWVPSNIVATAIFGDGAAAAIIENPIDGGESGPGASLGSLGPAGEHTWQDSIDVMGWSFDSHGFDVILQRNVAQLLIRDYPAALYGFLDRNGLTMKDIDRLCCHTGGIKIIEGLEEALDLGRGALDAERESLRDYGNMSAPSVLFVLQSLIAKGVTGRVLMTSFGAGFATAFQTITLNPAG